MTPTDQSEHWKPLHMLRPDQRVFRLQDGEIFVRTDEFTSNRQMVKTISCENGKSFYIYVGTPCWPLVLGGYREGSNG